MQELFHSGIWIFGVITIIGLFYGLIWNLKKH